MSRVVVDAEGDEVEHLVAPARRVVLPSSAVDRMADLGGVPSPAAQVATTRLGKVVDRLGSEPHPARAPDQGIDGLLGDAGLVEARQLTATGRAVLDVWRHPATAVELEMLLATRHGPVRVRSWHRQLGHWVVCLSTADARTFELAWLAADDWWLELGRAVWIDTSWFADPDGPAHLPAVIETSWELVLATGEAAARHRGDLTASLIADHSGRTRAGGSTASLVPARDSDVRTWLAVLAQTPRGRLHAAVLGAGGRGRPGVGIAEWVLLRDGWRSLTPVRRDGWNLVRIERKGPQDLGRELAALAARVGA